MGDFGDVLSEPEVVETIFLLDGQTSLYITAPDVFFPLESIVAITSDGEFHLEYESLESPFGIEIVSYFVDLTPLIELELELIDTLFVLTYSDPLERHKDGDLEFCAQVQINIPVGTFTGNPPQDTPQNNLEGGSTNAETSISNFGAQEAQSSCSASGQEQTLRSKLSGVDLDASYFFSTARSTQA